MERKGIPDKSPLDSKDRDTLRKAVSSASSPRYEGFRVGSRRKHACCAPFVVAAGRRGRSVRGESGARNRRTVEFEKEAWKKNPPRDGLTEKVRKNYASKQRRCLG